MKKSILSSVILSAIALNANASNVDVNHFLETAHKAQTERTDAAFAAVNQEYKFLNARDRMYVDGIANLTNLNGIIKDAAANTHTTADAPHGWEADKTDAQVREAHQNVDALKAEGRQARANEAVAHDNRGYAKVAVEAAARDAAVVAQTAAPKAAQEPVKAASNADVNHFLRTADMAAHHNATALATIKQEYQGLNSRDRLFVDGIANLTSSENIIKETAAQVHTGTDMAAGWDATKTEQQVREAHQSVDALNAQKAEAAQARANEAVAHDNRGFAKAAVQLAAREAAHQEATDAIDLAKTEGHTLNYVHAAREARDDSREAVELAGQQPVPHNLARQVYSERVTSGAVTPVANPVASAVVAPPANPIVTTANLQNSNNMPQQVKQATPNLSQIQSHNLKTVMTDPNATVAQKQAAQATYKQATTGVVTPPLPAVMTAAQKKAYAQATGAVAAPAPAAPSAAANAAALAAIKAANAPVAQAYNVPPAPSAAANAAAIAAQVAQAPVANPPVVVAQATPVAKPAVTAPTVNAPVQQPYMVPVAKAAVPAPTVNAPQTLIPQSTPVAKAAVPAPTMNAPQTLVPQSTPTLKVVSKPTINAPQTLIPQATPTVKAQPLTVDVPNPATSTVVVQNSAPVSVFDGSQIKANKAAAGANAIAIEQNKDAIATNAQGVADNKSAADVALRVGVIANSNAGMAYHTAVDAHTRIDAAQQTEAKHFTALQTGVKANSTAVVDLKSRAADLDARIAAQKVEQAKTNRAVANHTAQLSNHEARISDLEASTNSGFKDLKNQIESNRKDANAGIAGVAAMANIPQVTDSQQFSFGAGVGARDGQEAVAVGFSARVSENVVTKAAISSDTQNGWTMGAGVSYGW
ncbi:TPA: YadA-like family protein [Enterobacter cloacae]